MNREEMIPEPPPVMSALAPVPAQIREKWRKIYADKLKEELDDEPDREVAMRRENVERRHWKALRQANKLFEVPDCASHKDAMALEDWQVIVREVRGSELVVVTIDAKKYRFPVPPN